MLGPLLAKLTLWLWYVSTLGIRSCFNSRVVIWFTVLVEAKAPVSLLFPRSETRKREGNNESTSLVVLPTSAMHAMWSICFSVSLKFASKTSRVRYGLKKPTFSLSKYHNNKSTLWTTMYNLTWITILVDIIVLLWGWWGLVWIPHESRSEVTTVFPLQGRGLFEVGMT